MRTLVLLLLGAALLACGPGDTIDRYACPTQGTTLTYDNFGRGFLDQWCQTCHDAADGSRNGAPSAYDFHDRAAVLEYRDRIFARAADDNSSMPPGPDGPPSDERHHLAEWLACGAP